MNNGFYHSAEGSTWTKKNHKYIRKEGNRYIYPEDLQTNSARREGVGKRQTEFEESHRHGREMRQKYLSNNTFTQKRREDVAFNKGGVAKNETRPRVSEGIKDNITYKIDEGEAIRRWRSVNDPKRKEDKEAYGFDAADRFAGPTDKARETKTKERQARNRGIAANGSRAKNQADYKRLSEQRANRKAAANGKIVNPTYNMKDENGNTIFRLHSNDKIMPTAAQEYAKNQAMQKKQANNRTSVGSGAKNQEFAKQQSAAKKRKAALNSQGSTNRQQDAKEFKERDSQPVKASKEYYDSVRSNTKNDKEFNDYLDKHNVARPDGSKPQKVETWDNSKNIETWDNSKNIKTWDNEKAKKSTKGQKGHFTYDAKSGQTVFVPDDEGTKKRVSKGKQIVNKVKSLIKKK